MAENNEDLKKKEEANFFDEERIINDSAQNKNNNSDDSGVGDSNTNEATQVAEKQNDDGNSPDVKISDGADSTDEKDTKEVSESEKSDDAVPTVESYVPEPEPEEELSEPTNEFADNFDAKSKINLNTYKKKTKSKKPIRNFIAEVCDMKGYKKADNERRKKEGKPEIKMSKKLAAANLIWLGAKITVACTVFGPIVGCWLAMHYTNHEFATRVEQKAVNFGKFFTSLEGGKGPSR